MPTLEEITKALASIGVTPEDAPKRRPGRPRLPKPKKQKPSRSPSEASWPATGPYLVGQPLPTALGAADMCRLFGIGVRAYYLKQRQGLFKKFELRHPPSRNRKYSGALLMDYFKNGGRANGR